MYFEKFPLTFYSQDDLTSVQVVTNIMTRAVFSDEVKNNLSIFDEYDIKDGETPETLAYTVYGSTEYHWVILHTNDIIDARFDWPLTTYNLGQYVNGKYNDRDGIHHYEDTNELYTNGNLYLTSNVAFGSFIANSVITNNTNTGTAIVTSKVSSSNIIITVSSGGFKTGDLIKLYSNSAINANITATSFIAGTAVTNYDYEDTVNETKRRIKILKPEYLSSIEKDFNSKFENTNG